MSSSSSQRLWRDTGHRERHGKQGGKGGEEGREEGRRERKRDGKSTVHFPITQLLTMGHSYLAPLPLCPSHNYGTLPKPALSQTVLDIATYFTGDHIGSLTNAQSTLPDWDLNPKSMYKEALLLCPTSQEGYKAMGFNLWVSTPWTGNTLSRESHISYSSYQKFCLSDVYISVNNRSKIIVTKLQSSNKKNNFMVGGHQRMSSSKESQRQEG